MTNKSFFLSSNSGKGIYHYFNNEAQSLNYIYILKGVPGNGKSEVLKNIANYLEGEQRPIELIYSSFDFKTLDGLIVLDRNIGIFDGNYPYPMEPALPYISGETVDLATAVDHSKLQNNLKDIKSLFNEKEQLLENYATHIKKSRQLHDNVEFYFSTSIDIEKAQALNNQILENIFGKSYQEKESIVKHRFFDTITENGNFDFVQNLTSNLTKRFFIKGRPGSGKSTLLKQIVSQAIENGFDIELYHCDFDPHSLDMIIIPELSVAAFDSTAPHNYEPERSGDEIVDTYQSIIDNQIDEKYANEIAEGTKQWQDAWKEAAHFLKEAKEKHKAITNLYKQTIDDEEIKNKEKHIIESL
ncbi:hypothetical protein [Staphylococcus nepalensis]|uniref:hypothetical protein n=1 Tax=Staphylococcus nepalensis TaxID=214473 RepID=UPI0031BAB809